MGIWAWWRVGKPEAGVGGEDGEEVEDERLGGRGEGA